MSPQRDGFVNGAIPNRWCTENGITPMVATDPQSVKRGEKQVNAEPGCVIQPKQESAAGHSAFTQGNAAVPATNQD
jgi:hypothetical protein